MYLWTAREPALPSRIQERNWISAAAAAAAAQTISLQPLCPHARWIRADTLQYWTNWQQRRPPSSFHTLRSHCYIAAENEVSKRHLSHVIWPHFICMN